MDEIYTIIKQDLEVAKNAIEEDNFKFIVMIGNRIMTNIYSANKSELMILGWIIRDIGGDLNYIKEFRSKTKGKTQKGLRESPDIMPMVKKLPSDYLTSVENNIVQNNLNFNGIYDKYVEMQSELKKYILSPAERNGYKESVEFSRKFAIRMIELFCNRRDVLFSENNNLTQTILNELARNYNEHGGRDALTSYLVLKTFSEFYKYAHFDLFGDGSLPLWDVKTKLNEYLDLINKFMLILSGDSPGTLSAVFEEIVAKSGIDYRYYYLNYGDLSVRDQQKGK